MQKLSVVLLLLAFCHIVLSHRTQQSLGNYFRILDFNGDGQLDELEISQMGKKSSSMLLQHRKDQIQKILNHFDKDHSRTLSLEEITVGLELKDPIEGGPQQIHLALTGDPTEMLVKWVTKDDNGSIVSYGTSSGVYNFNATGTVTTYDVGVDGWDGLVHTVLLTGLTPSTTYYYTAGSSSSMSDEFVFTTAPPNGQETPSMVAVVADMGTSIPMGWAVLDQIANDHQTYHFNMALHAGDVAYAGTGHEWEFEEIWDIYGDLLQKVAANIPYMFSVGNHEHYYNFTSFKTRYTMPQNGNGNFWYSFDYGSVHYTCMSTEHPYTPGSPQYDWLIQDLSSAATDSKINWIIMSGHRPMYNSDTDEWDSHKPGAQFQVIIEPLMIKYNVDLYLCGHMHMYERVHPVINGTVVQSGNVYRDPHATAHVIQATSGTFQDSSFVTPQPAWSADRDNKFGYGRMQIFNSTHLHYEYVHQEDSSILDQFWLIKN